MHPKDATDYPGLPVDVYVIWRGNGSIWPSQHRSMVFLSGSKKQLDGSARFSRDWTDAKTFPDRISANDWMAENRSKRGQAYDGAEITTIAELIARRFPTK
ncbi:MAG: hypothetical protein EOP22_14890 [Hyphomicrobiales bacterium]|nr:MAG: hypothetical protein EOP22_14890 [Hyphomicrobiales bacterium]